jgi:hypothetical protein
MERLIVTHASVVSGDMVLEDDFIIIGCLRFRIAVWDKDIDEDEAVILMF